MVLIVSKVCFGLSMDVLRVFEANAYAFLNFLS